MNNSVYYMLMAILAELQSQRPELGLAERSELQARADSFTRKAFTYSAKARLEDIFSCPAAPSKREDYDTD